MKSFGIGFLTGALIGTVVGYLKNPNTGNTIKHDLKLQIEDTRADTTKIQTGINNIKTKQDYLMNEGQSKVNQFVDDMTDRLDGFQMEIAPNLKRINEKLTDLDKHLNEFAEKN